MACLSLYVGLLYGLSFECGLPLQYCFKWRSYGILFIIFFLNSVCCLLQAQYVCLLFFIVCWRSFGLYSCVVLEFFFVSSWFLGSALGSIFCYCGVCCWFCIWSCICVCISVCISSCTLSLMQSILSFTIWLTVFFIVVVVIGSVFVFFSLLISSYIAFISFSSAVFSWFYGQVSFVSLLICNWASSSFIIFFVCAWISLIFWISYWRVLFSCSVSGRVAISSFTFASSSYSCFISSSSSELISVIEICFLSFSLSESAEIFFCFSNSLPSSLSMVFLSSDEDSMLSILTSRSYSLSYCSWFCSWLFSFYCLVVLFSLLMCSLCSFTFSCHSLLVEWISSSVILRFLFSSSNCLSFLFMLSSLILLLFFRSLCC